MSKFSIAKHPMHPALVALPIGLMLWTFACDVIYVLSGKDAMWYNFAVYSGAAAIITALGAALPGFGDYLTMRMRDEVRRIATAHMLINLAVVALFGVAFVLMLKHNAVDGSSLVAVVVLHFVGVGMLGLSGWLGGEMVFRHHVGVVDDAVEQEQANRRTVVPRPGPQPR